MRRIGFQWDSEGRVQCVPVIPESGKERVAAYRRRHPDRVAAYNAQRRAQRQAQREAERAAQAERFAARQAELAAEKAALIRKPLLLPAPPVRLCLPAPSEEPMFILPQAKPEPVLVEAEREKSRERRAA